MSSKAAAVTTKTSQKQSSSSVGNNNRRRQREEVDEKETNNNIKNENASPSSIILCDKEIIKAVKTQMIPLQQFRSDVVDVRNNELGLRECHIVAALLGDCDKIEGCRVKQQPEKEKKKDQELQQQKEDSTAGEEQGKKIAPFFDRVHTMRLQLSSSILPSHQNQSKNPPRNNNNKNLNNFECQGGFDVILSAIQQFHAPYLRRLDLSRNRFFTRNSNIPQALVTRNREIELLTSTLVSCQKLTILDLSHNVNLRSDGAVAICRDVATKLPSLRALLMQRCSVDDSGAIEIAALFAQGKLPAFKPTSQQKENNKKNHHLVGDTDDSDNDDNEKEETTIQQKKKMKTISKKDENGVVVVTKTKEVVMDFVIGTDFGNRRSSYSVVLTLDLSCNRIGPSGLIALSKSIPDCVGLGCEKQSPPLLIKKERKEAREAVKK